MRRQLSHSRLDAKAVMALGRGGRIDEHVLDPRPRRPAPDGALEPDERLVVAVRLDLDRPVGQVAHPPVDPLARGRIPRVRTGTLPPARGPTRRTGVR